MKAMIIAITGLLLMGIGFFLGAIWGIKEGAFNAALEENKLAANLLTHKEVALSAEFTEYLKGRIYYNIATKYPNDRGYLQRKNWDFGKVQLTQLPPMSYAKDPTFDCNSFAEATKNLTKAEAANDQMSTRAESPAQ